MYDKKYKNNYLEHYNHNHDALGRFAKSSGARVSQKKLRAAEVNRVKALGKEMRADYKYGKARANYESGGSSNSKKRDKVSKREKEYISAVKNRQRAEKQKNDLLKKTYNNGYEVSGYSTMRSSQRGKDFTNYVIGTSIIGMPAVLAKNTSQAQKYVAKYNNQTPSRIRMTKYTVNDKNKTKKPTKRRKAVSYMLYD